MNAEERLEKAQRDLTEMLEDAETSPAKMREYVKGMAGGAFKAGEWLMNNDGGARMVAEDGLFGRAVNYLCNQCLSTANPCYHAGLFTRRATGEEIDRALSDTNKIRLARAAGALLIAKHNKE